jgi:hypothetical protein
LPFGEKLAPKICPWAIIVVAPVVMSTIPRPDSFAAFFSFVDWMSTAT